MVFPRCFVCRCAWHLYHGSSVSLHYCKDDELNCDFMAILPPRFFPLAKRPSINRVAIANRFGLALCNRTITARPPTKRQRRLLFRAHARNICAGAAHVVEISILAFSRCSKAHRYTRLSVHSRIRSGFCGKELYIFVSPAGRVLGPRRIRTCGTVGCPSPLAPPTRRGSKRSVRSRQMGVSLCVCIGATGREDWSSYISVVSVRC